MAPNPFDQHGFGLRLEWGAEGLAALAPHCDAVVVVDVLRFSTAVTVAVEAGATVVPSPWRAGGATLSPVALRSTPPGERLVLPSPNGSALSVAAVSLGAGLVAAGCLRNAGAVADHLDAIGAGVVGVVAAGERWKSASGPTGPLRPSLEDHVGAGAIVAALLEGTGGSRLAPSPEAAAAAAAFAAARDAPGGLAAALLDSCSGRELVAVGHRDDVLLAAELDASRAVPVLVGDAFAAAPV